MTEKSIASLPDMSKSLVERLRDVDVHDSYDCWMNAHLFAEAAAELERLSPAGEGEAVAVTEPREKLTEYELQVLLGTSIHGCNMNPDRVFSLDMAWHRLHAIGFIDRTDGLAIITEKGQAYVRAALEAAPSEGTKT